MVNTETHKSRQKVSTECSALHGMPIAMPSPEDSVSITKAVQKDLKNQKLRRTRVKLCLLDRAGADHCLMNSQQLWLPAQVLHNNQASQQSSQEKGLMKSYQQLMVHHQGKSVFFNGVAPGRLTMFQWSLTHE